jgi:hypothetical protein
VIVQVPIDPLQTKQERHRIRVDGVLVLKDMPILIDTRCNNHTTAIFEKERDMVHEFLSLSGICQDLKRADALSDIAGMKDDSIVTKMRKLDCREGRQFPFEVVLDLE